MRVLAVVNLNAGQSDIGMSDFMRAIGRTGAEITVRYITGGTTIAHLLRDAAHFDRVVVAGGDGTVSSACYALRDVDVPILAYPAGTANLLATNLGLPLDANDLACIALSNHEIDADLGEYIIGDPGDPARRVGGFVVAAGAGFDARIMEAAQELKPSIGVASYFVGALQNLAPKVSRFRLTLDGRQVETEGIAVLVVNFAKLQFDISITHRSDPTDGELEVVVLRTRNVAELIPAAWAALVDRTTGQHPGRSAGLEIHSAREITVDADPPQPFQYDGEVVSETTPFTAHVIPGAARLLVPEDWQP